MVKYVKNSNGTMVDYDAAVLMMDDDIRENLAFSGDFETEQDFFTAYAKAHFEKYGEEWELDKPNPVY